jgi:hypothetical protein
MIRSRLARKFGGQEIRMRSIRIAAALLTVVGVLASCGPSKEERAAAAATAAAANVRAEMQRRTYEDVEGKAGCTKDCSGHNAGFAYAQRNGITDPTVCNGKSDSFVEGCQAYGEEISYCASAAHEAIIQGKTPAAHCQD